MKKNRCQFMIPILKMSLRKKKDLLEKEDLMGKKTTSKTLCSSMIQTTLNVDFEEDFNTKSHELMSFGKSIIIKVDSTCPINIGSFLCIEYIFVRVEYEWKPPHCVDCQSFGHETNLCPKRVREELPKNSARDTKATAMEENDDGFIEVKSRKKKKGADSRSFGGLRLNKPNSKVIWQQKKGTKGGSNSASPSVSTNDSGKGNGGSKQDLNTSNPFDVLNVEGDDMGDSGKQSKGSEQVNSDFNVNNKKDHEPSSSKSACNDVHKDKNVSSYPELKKWDCINESDTDDDDVIPSYGSFLGGGNQLEDEDFDFYDGYEEQVVDLDGALKEFRDFKLSMSGLFDCCTYVQLRSMPKGICRLHRPGFSSVVIFQTEGVPFSANATGTSLTLDGS
ncbi:hypothetical protein Tco_0508474 [Tanacetum coccineum]